MALSQKNHQQKVMASTEIVSKKFVLIFGKNDKEKPIAVDGTKN